MWAMIRRAGFPVLLLLGGAALLAYGAKFHSLPVVEEQEIEETIVPPSRPEPEARLEPHPPTVEKQIRIRRVTKSESEPTLIREMTVGGVALAREESIISIFGVILLASGELEQTYSGEVPTLCPT